MRLPNAEKARVEREKVTDYLLSKANPRGRRKADFFLRFGFTVDRWQDFAAALRIQSERHAVAKVVETFHGPRYHVDGTIETPDRRNPWVRTVWQIDYGNDYPRFITAFPRKR